jgi:hypothetical protein
MSDKQILISLTPEEIRHMAQLAGKDIGWHIKHGNPEKSEIARKIYLKLNQKVKDHG